MNSTKPLEENNETEEDEYVLCIWKAITALGFFDPKVQSQEYWIQQTLLDFLELYRRETIVEVIANGSEQDFVNNSHYIASSISTISNQEPQPEQSNASSNKYYRPKGTKKWSTWNALTHFLSQNSTDEEREEWEDIIRQYNDGELTTTTAQLAAICARMNEEHQKKLEEKVKRMNHMMEQPAPMDLDVRQQLGRAFRREIMSVNHRASVAMGWNVGTLMSPQFETDWMLTTPIVSSSPRLTRKPTKKKSTVKDLMIELCNNEVDKNLTKFPWKSFKRVSNGGIIRYRNETLGCEFTGFDCGEKADTALCPSDMPYKRWSELYDALINGQISFEKL
ncbi:hypothetical protein BDB00DRAFT_793018 [Zychaea mexicana]|uniref:uncharacterized protein n=1 Tax=Zychaea mexicana TaxID=64656 RepID=UPI0022FF15CD|nr:uncharacterized protein BDB00DRAFT_793018 [Zychaea mexicana]KAI9482600.1 hypothetical protein BDB00DRAFT_793018 [Zychaea mexicana]